MIPINYKITKFSLSLYIILTNMGRQIGMLVGDRKQGINKSLS